MFVACLVAGQIALCKAPLHYSSKLKEVSHKVVPMSATNRKVYGAPLFNRKDAHQKITVASWYGPGFHGRPMANGRRFDMHDPTTVAHKELPLGTRVELTNIQNGRSLVATVRDRGPYVHGREFDVSLAGAQKLGFEKKGTATVAYRILAPGAS